MVAPDRLDSILLEAADINSVMGVSTMQPQAPIGHTTGSNQTTLSNPDCVGTFYPGQSVVYQGSGYTAVSVQQLSEAGDVHYHLVAQAAASFPSADQALAFLKTSAGKWGACAGQTITQTAQGQDSRWTFGNLIGEVPALTQVRTLEAGNGQACQHVLRALVNVVIEVAACGPRIGDQANQLADEMARNVTRLAR
jgi:serine/threonine-protein kinase